MLRTYLARICTILVVLGLLTQLSHASASNLYGLPASPNWTAIQSPDISRTYANLVRDAGDINGDGFDDVVVADYEENPTGSNQLGAIYVYYGSASGLSTSIGTYIPGLQTQSAFGYAADGAGDVNGDGYSDVIVGAHYFNSALSSSGKVYLFYGSAGGLSTTPGWSYEGVHANDHLGLTVAGIHDVNGDDYSDFIVGVPYYDDPYNAPLTNIGQFLVFYGSSSGPGTNPSRSYTGFGASDEVGKEIPAGGDFNNDGYGDIAIPRMNTDYDIGHPNAGSVSIYNGSANGLSTNMSRYLYGTQTGEMFGYSLAAGDSNNDGYDDLFVNAMQNYSTGKIMLYLGSSSGIPTTSSWTLQGTAGSNLGHEMDTAGDVNGDGYDDLLFIVPSYTNPQTAEGLAVIYYGTATIPSTQPAWSYETNKNNGGFNSGHFAGDVNGDSLSDIILGAWDYENAWNNKGKVWSFYGAPDAITNLTLSHGADIHPGQSNHYVQSVATGTQVSYSCTFDVPAQSLNTTGKEFDLTIDIEVEVTCTAVNSLGSVTYTEQLILK